MLLYAFSFGITGFIKNLLPSWHLSYWMGLLLGETIKDPPQKKSSCAPVGDKSFSFSTCGENAP